MKKLLLSSLVTTLLLLAAIIVVMANDEQQDEEIEPAAVTQVLFPWFSNILGVISFYLLARYLHIFPYTAVMFILGTCMGVGNSRLHIIIVEDDDNNNTSSSSQQLHASLALWENINGELLLATFLPGLLFQDAFCSNVHLMALAFTQCLIMALYVS